MKDKWWDRIAEKVQNIADSRNSREFFFGENCLWTFELRIYPLQSADGSILIKFQEGLRNQWQSTLLNRPSTVNPAALYQVPELLTQEELDQPFSRDKITKALNWMNSGKDGIPAKVYNAGRYQGFPHEMMPEDFWDALIVALYKAKAVKSIMEITGASLFCQLQGISSFASSWTD